MKKTLKTLAIATASLITTGAMAGVTKNIENPLYMPAAGEFVSKTGVGLMYKRADHTDALKAKHHDGANEFPVWRFTEDFGYGITDRLNVYASAGWTQNDDIDRKGAHRGRLGLSYRVIETLENLVWDMYGEAYLSGVSKMKGSYTMGSGFKYDNFSNGRWGAVVGTKVGKTWSKLTTTLFAEYLQTFGNHNNKIEVNLPGVDEISVDLKSTKEITVGTNAFYQLDDRWSFGGGFRFVEHTDNGVKSIHTDLSGAPAPVANGLRNLATGMKDMNDGWDEYILSAVVANQITDSFQLALFAEYTFDHSHKNSQNGTDAKAEMGVRANVRF